MHLMVTASTLALLTLACARHAAPEMKRLQTQAATVVRSAWEQARIAHGMLTWRGLSAVPHLRSMAPGMLAQIKDDAARATAAAR